MANEMERTTLISFLQDLVNRAGEKKPTDKAFANIEAQVEYNGSQDRAACRSAQHDTAGGAQWLARLEQAEEEVINIHEVIDAHPWDGCVASSRRCSRPMAGPARHQPDRGGAGTRRP